MPRYVGLDVHSKRSVFVAQDEEGQLVGEGTIDTTVEGLREMRDRLGLVGDTPVALESGTVAFFVAEQLADLGMRPLIIDAREVRAKASRPFQKSDRRDALELCEGLRRNYYRCIVAVPPSSIRELRETLSRRRHFVCLRTAQVNAVKRLLRATGRVKLARSLQSRVGWTRLIESLTSCPRLQGFVRCHHAVWCSVGKQIEILEKEIMFLTVPWSVEITRLKTVPGVGPIVASTVLAVLFDARRFPSAKHVASYAGLVPRTDQSGDRNHTGHIIRRGSGELRSMLCEAAHHARRTTHPLNPYFTRLCARRGYRMAIVAVAHRLCRILYAILRDGKPFTLEKAGVEAGSFKKVRELHFRKLATT